MFGRKDSKDEGWKHLRSEVDRIMENTRGEREQMRRDLETFCGNVYETSKLNEYDSKAFINIIFSTIMAVAPMMTDNRPVWNVVPRWSWLEDLGWSYSNALKAAWDQLDMSMTVYRWVLDAMIMRVGIVKVFYDANRKWGGDIGVEVVDPRTFFIAPGYDEIWKAHMCGTRTKMPLYRVKKMFPDKKITPITGDGDPEPAGTQKYTQSDSGKDGKNWAILYEVWLEDDGVMEDYEENGQKKQRPKNPNGKFVYFTDNEYLGTKPSPFDHGLPPYVELWDYIRPHSFLGISEADQIRGLMQELNTQLQSVSAHTRKYSKPNKFQDTSQFTDPEDYNSTCLDGDQVYAADRRGATSAPVEFEQPPPLVPEVYELLKAIPQIAEEITGVTDVTKGVASKLQRQTAAEIGILLETSHTRTRQRVRNLEWSIARLCYMFVSMMQQYYGDQRNLAWREDGATRYGKISNSTGFAKQMYDQDLAVRQEAGERLNPEELEQYEAYKEFMEVFGKNKDKDPVLFQFTIVVETNSSLPLDKQTLANLMLKLYEREAVDREALLETLRIPNARQIIDRMDQKEMEMAGIAGSGQRGPMTPLPPVGAERGAQTLEAV